MRFCLICSEYPPELHGGAGTFAQVFGRALVNAGHSVRVVGIHRSGPSAPDYEEDEGVRVWRLKEPESRFGWVKARYQQYQLVKRWILSGDVDFVEAPDHEGQFAGWPRLPVPLVHRAGGAFSYFAHELGNKMDMRLFRLERWSYLRADAWIAKSRYVGEVTRRVFRLPSGPAAVLFNPVDFPKSVPTIGERDRNRVVFSGTLTPKKGIVTLIDAWPTVVRDHPSATLDVYGKDPRLGSSVSTESELLGRLPIEARGSVRFHGHVQRNTLLERLGTARAAVFPSYAEGFAWAPLEAMARGCPTIYTKLGSGPELIEHGRDGLLVNPDAPGEIAAAILAILKDNRLACQIAESGRRRIDSSFTLEKLLPVNETFYAELLRDFGMKRARGGAYPGLI